MSRFSSKPLYYVLQATIGVWGMNVGGGFSHQRWAEQQDIRASFLVIFGFFSFFLFFSFIYLFIYLFHITRTPSTCMALAVFFFSFFFFFFFFTLFYHIHITEKYELGRPLLLHIYTLIVFNIQGVLKSGITPICLLLPK